MVSWEGLKKEWQEMPKIRKWDIVVFCVAIVSCAILIMMGITQMAKYADAVTAEVKYFVGGVFIASSGFFVFNYLYSRNIWNTLDRYIKEVEKVKE